MDTATADRTMAAAIPDPATEEATREHTEARIIPVTEDQEDRVMSRGIIPMRTSARCSMTMRKKGTPADTAEMTVAEAMKTFQEEGTTAPDPVNTAPATVITSAREEAAHSVISAATGISTKYQVPGIKY